MVTTSQSPNTSRPSIFDLTGRAKWDAWDKASKEFAGKSLEEVQQRYLDVCSSLGWEPALNVDPSTTEDDEEPIDWSTPYEPDKGNGDHNGMGNSVSVLETDEEEIDATTIHGLAVLGDVGKLETFLDLSPDSVNEFDEYVRALFSIV